MELKNTSEEWDALHAEERGNSKIPERRKLFQNVTHLFFFQAINCILPLITIPYILRVVGPEKFGILSFGQAVNQFFVMIAEYGFNITGTQRLSQERDSHIRCNEIFSEILFAKLFLLFICLIILVAAFLLFEEVRIYSTVYFLYFMMIPAYILYSNWFFMGMEEMHYLHYPNVISKMCYAALIFIFLKNESDYTDVPLFFGSTLIVGGIIAMAIIRFRFHIRISIPALSSIWRSLSNGWSIFVSTFSISLYRQSNTFILGLVASKEVVGYYSAGEKIIKALQSVFAPVIQAFYPFISRKRKQSGKSSWIAIKVLMKWMGLSAALMSLILFVFAEQLGMLFMGEQFLPSIPVFKIATFVIFLGVMNYILGIIFMTNFQMKDNFAQGVVITGICNIPLCYLLSIRFQEIGAAISFLGAEMLLMVLLLLFIGTKQSVWRKSLES